jgi:hypothetical protein
MYNWDGQDPSGVFHILGMHSGEIVETDIGSWLQTEFDYRLDNDPSSKNFYYGDKNNIPQLLNTNADLRAQVEINKGAILKKDEVIQIGLTHENAISAIEGVFTLPEVDATLTEIDPHNLGLYDTLPVNVPTDNHYQLGMPKDNPQLYKPEYTESGYESASPVTAYIMGTLDYSRATSMDRVKFADSVHLVDDYHKGDGRFIYRGSIYLFPVSEGEQYDRYIRLNFSTNSHILLAEYMGGYQTILTQEVYTGDPQTETLQRNISGEAVVSPLASYDPVSGYLTLNEPVYWSIDPEYIDDSYAWMQKHQAGGGYAEKEGNSWQWINQNQAYVPMGSITGVDRSGYMSWLKYKNILLRLAALEAGQ